MDIGLHRLQCVVDFDSAWLFVSFSECILKIPYRIVVKPVQMSFAIVNMDDFYITFVQLEDC